MTRVSANARGAAVLGALAAALSCGGGQMMDASGTNARFELTRTVTPSAKAAQGTRARRTASTNTTAANVFTKLCRARSGAIATGRPSCNSHFPSRPSAQTRNSSTVICLAAASLMGQGYHNFAVAAHAV